MAFSGVGDVVKSAVLASVISTLPGFIHLHLEAGNAASLQRARCMPMTRAMSHISFLLIGQRIAGGMSLRRARARLSVEKWFAPALSDDGVRIRTHASSAGIETV
jgi:hypothetical protein